MLYIQKNIQFLELEQELPDSYLVGDNIENYEDGAYLLLSEKCTLANQQYPFFLLIQRQPCLCS